ncbi:ROK family protein [Streptomyces sp. NPDC059506]|uniref:ROK family transcriptional regulator n=1 Tax=Streptomyces TaxID=1883 RepID=UPI0021756333|nr:ROK family transcriptional regulator [Streptomyces sp. SCUT-3]
MTIGPNGANLLALRSHNTALVLDLLRAATAQGGPGLGRRALAERTGLTPQAVSKIVARLRDEGLVAEAGRGASTGGKPHTLLRLAAGARYAVGVHLDRDELTVVLADLTGEPVALRSGPFDFGDAPDRVLDGVAGRVREVTAGTGRERLLGVGVACPGPLDHFEGVLRRVVRLPQWDGFPLRDALAARLGLPVVLDKDTNAAVLAVPAGAGSGSFAYLHLGTGLGAGLVLDGEPYRGARTGAGEFGHQTVQLDGPVCGCGNRGCLEVLCLAAVAAGDHVRAARLMGTGAADLVRLLDLDRFVLGGRVVGARPELFAAEVAGELERRGTPVPVEAGPARPAAVAVGAAALVLGPFFGARTPRPPAVSAG